MIRNLKTNGDAEKKLMLLKESLQLAIKNDESVSAARAGFQQGKPLEVSVEDNKTLAERIADSDKQLADARTNLMQVFKPQEVLTIIGLLDKDQIITINTLWAGMKKELEKVNTKLMTPQDFITFLNKYTESAVSLQGALNVGINSPEELKELILDELTAQKLIRFLKSRVSQKTSYLVDIATNLKDVLPIALEYDKLFTYPATTIQPAIDDIIKLYPNKKVIDDAIEAGNLDKIEKMLQGISPDKIQQMFNIKRSLLSSNTNPLSILGFTPEQEKVIKDFQDAMTLKNREFYASLPPALQNVLSQRVKKPRLVLSPPEQQAYDRFIAFNETEVDNYIKSQSYEDSKTLEDALLRNGYISKRKGQLTKINPRKVIIGSGASRPRGRPPTATGRPKMKVGQGLKSETLPTNVEFGKYALNSRQLKKQILSLKSKSGGQLTWFQATPISDGFSEMLHEMISGKGLNKHILKTLDKDEQSLFYEVADRAGLADQFQLVKPKDTKEEDIKKRFDVLLGMYKAGNNNPSLIGELRKHIIYYTNKGKIPKAKSLAMLLELS